MTWIHYVGTRGSAFGIVGEYTARQFPSGFALIGKYLAQHHGVNDLCITDDAGENHIFKRKDEAPEKQPSHPVNPVNPVQK